MEKLIIILQACVFFTATMARAGIADPVIDYKASLGVPAGTVFLRWEADIDGDGKNEVFLSIKSEYDEDVKDGQLQSWSVYFADHNDANFTPSSGTDFSDNHGVGPGLAQIDPSLMYIGPITQLNTRGIVTAQTDYPRKGTPVRYIYAYTIVDNHLKRTLLAKYNALENNVVFASYLAGNKPSHVVLQEIAP